MKYIVFIISILFFAGCNNSRVQENINNSKKLKIGMSLDEALKIMGEPDETRIVRYNKRYFYQPPFGASDWITFDVDTSQVVVAVEPFHTE